MNELKNDKLMKSNPLLFSRCILAPTKLIEMIDNENKTKENNGKRADADR